LDLLERDETSFEAITMRIVDRYCAGRVLLAAGSPRPFVGWWAKGMNTGT